MYDRQKEFKSEEEIFGQLSKKCLFFIAWRDFWEAGVNNKNFPLLDAVAYTM